MKIFISYAREDLSEAKQLYQCLKNYNDLTPWIDIENILPGMDWENEILSALEDCNFVVILLSKNSINKVGYFQREVKETLNKLSYYPPDKIFLIPARLDNVIPKQKEIKKLQYIDLYKNWDEAVVKIVDAIRYTIKRTETLSSPKIQDETIEKQIESSQKNQYSFDEKTLSKINKNLNVYLFNDDLTINIIYLRVIYRIADQDTKGVNAEIIYNYLSLLGYSENEIKESIVNLMHPARKLLECDFKINQNTLDKRIWQLGRPITLNTLGKAYFSELITSPYYLSWAFSQIKSLENLSNSTPRHRLIDRISWMLECFKIINRHDTEPYTTAPIGSREYPILGITYEDVCFPTRSSYKFPTLDVFFKVLPTYVNSLHKHLRNLKMGGNKNEILETIDLGKNWLDYAKHLLSISVEIQQGQRITQWEFEFSFAEHEFDNFI
jgi:hypothetical protein